LEAARAAVIAGVRAAGERSRTARDVMTGPARWVDHDTTVDEALRLCRRFGITGVAVARDARLVGTVSEADLRRAVGHELGHAPVKAVMTSGVAALEEATPVAQVAAVLAASPIGAVPVVRVGAPTQQPLVEDVTGVVRRSDVIGGWGPAPAAAATAAPNLASRLDELGLADLLEHIQAIGTSYAGVYLVGGAVRDLLLHERTIDIDVAVEGDGIAFAQELARRLGGHLRAHPKFRTAVVVAAEADGGEGLRVDVASTRSEFYQAPATLPVVEHAPLRSDLARRDFTMNAMAVSLRAEDFGTLHDYFGGLRDLGARRIVVLHNLSFIEDPTRIFRALRYEARYGLRMDAHTYNLALACSHMDLVGDLSSARLRDELVLLLREPRVDHAIQRMHELGVGRAVHPRLTTGATTRGLLRAAEGRWRRYGLAAEVPLWRLRLVWLLRNLSPEEITAWAERMTFRRDDRVVLEAAMVVGRRLRERLAAGMSEADLWEAASGQPVEALVVAMVLDEGGSVERRVAHYLAHTRNVALHIGGHDLLAIGFKPGPGLGAVLHTLMRMKLNGMLTTRADEIEAARRLL
jgi:tRNA nucleotidyltransferase (CCA-adding enzyme)